MAEESSRCTLSISENEVILGNDIVSVRYDKRTGMFSLKSDERDVEIVSRAFVRIQTDRQSYESRELIFRGVSAVDFKERGRSGKAVVISMRSVDGNIEARLRLAVWEGLEGLFCRVQLKNASRSEIGVHSMDVFCVDVGHERTLSVGNGEALRFFYNGFHSWELSQVRPIDSGENVSHLFTVVTNVDRGEVLLVGFVTLANQLTTVTAYGKEEESGENVRLKQLVARCALDNISVEPGGHVISEELLVLAGERATTIAEQYADIVAARMAPRHPEKSPTGWCSWYFYFTMPDYDEIVQNAEFVRQRFPELEWIQLDDGYQRTVGDWTENERFSRGLPSLVDEIRRRGLRAGIWTAPFVASEHSELFKDRPHWFVRDRNNQPIAVGSNPLWLGNYYALDLTNPDVLSHIGRLFKRLREAGFEYFKIDFLYHATQEGVRHDPSHTCAQALRKGLEAIREAVGEALILGCGAPLGPCVGIVDAMRIGTDIGTNWRYDWGGGVYECAVNTMSRAFVHRRWWINDPDCVLVRQEDNDLTPDEVVLWLTVVALSGGSFLLSDRMMEVAEERLALVDKVLPPYHRGAVAIDAFVESEPRVFALPIETPLGRWSVVGVFNLSESKMDFDFRLEDVSLSEPGLYHIFEFWSQTYEGTVEEAVPIRGLKPHSCKLYVLRPDSPVPSVLSTSIHFTQGAVELEGEKWDEQRLELSVRIKRDTRAVESVFIVFGADWRPRVAKINDEVVSAESIAPEVVAVRGKFSRGDEVVLSFERLDA